MSKYGIMSEIGRFWTMGLWNSFFIFKNFKNDNPLFSYSNQTDSTFILSSIFKKDTGFF